jgi:hypothetical protein
MRACLGELAPSSRARRAALVALTPYACLSSQSVLFQCKHVLETHFSKVFHQRAQEGSEKHACESPTSIFDDLNMVGGAHFTPVPAKGNSSNA